MWWTTRQRAALPIDLCDLRSEAFDVVPGTREAEQVNVKLKRGRDVLDV
jgi:hypothetical protein